MTVRLPPAPRRMVRLRSNPAGYPVPWFVDDGSEDPDFRVIPAGKIAYAVRHHRCWLCGTELGRMRASVVGPMCVINRTSSEPPSHQDCGIYAAIACPFLSNPARRRREGGLAPDLVPAAGVAIDRNPGVAVVWTSRNPRPFRPPDGRGVLFNIGHPEQVLWFAEGRPATRAECKASIASGLPLLEEAAELDGPAAVAQLHRMVAQLDPLLPSL